ncbi:MAG: BatA domain-containing protein [Planctomycetaceae bacterium]|nr:BatA domain-containing protein [Planctomycetaceae bacterium]
MGFFSSLSFLTPLYFAAGLAIAGPILFHLIRRTPKGRQDFSSVMFLTPSPPRITRRSRIENWLLLLLRILAILLIVAAFTRPLWREFQSGLDDSDGRELVVLLDQSASMQRVGLWDEAVERVQTLLADLTPGDQLTVLTFDDQVHPLMDRTEWLELDPAQRTAVVEGRLEELRPGWGASYLDRALIEAADRLEQVDAGPGSFRPRRVVVIADLQAGSRWEGLQGHEWPKGVAVELMRVGAESPPTNAGVQLVGLPQMDDPPFVRVRVSSSDGSTTEKFELGWRGAFDDPATPGPTSGVVSVYVPPGQSRVVRLPQAEGDIAAAKVVLVGDEHPFDNLCHLTWPERREERIVYLGADTASDREGLRFFLEPLFADTEERNVTILDGWPQTTDASEPGNGVANEAAADDSQVALVIVGGELESVQQTQLRNWLQSGGTALFVVVSGESAAGLYALADLPVADVTEAVVDGYAMLREVDFDHPLFRMLNDPRYSDVSKVRFWKHRVVSEDSLGKGRVLARFDDGSIAMAEVPVGTGRLYVLTSGWDRSDSQLATWPKFIPIMNALLEVARPKRGGVSQGTVGEPLPVEIFAALTPAPAEVVLPRGDHRSWSEFMTAPIPTEPGLYRIMAAAEGSEAEPNVLATVAVNLPADESQTEPLAADVLDSLGIRLTGEGQPEAVDAPREEQLARGELESRQKLWRWLLGAALAVLLLETLLAARRGSVGEAPATV